MGSLRRTTFAVAVAATISAVLLVLRPAAAAPGHLDTTFGSGGTVDTAIGTTAYATDVAVQPDAKIVAGGTSSVATGNGYLSSFALARYQPDGRLDAGFGAGGVATGPCCGAFAVALQPDGKILQAGFSGRANRAAFAVTRYRSDGALDGTFGSGGVALGPDGGAEGLTVQPDGKIVVAGTATEAYAFNLARFNADGTLDQGFGSGGTVQTLLGYAASAQAVVIQPDGKIVTVGASVPGNPPPPPPPPPAPPPPPPPGPPPLPWQITLVRYEPDGSLDASFGSSGVVKTPLGFSAQAHAVGLQPDGKIVVAGQTDDRMRGVRRPALARYGPDGALDPAFGSSGIVTTELRTSGWPMALALQPDGMIVVTGGEEGTARFRPSGKLDREFGSDGVAAAGFPSPIRATSVALQTDGRIVTAGFRSVQGQSRFALSRYLAKSPTTITAAPAVVTYGRRALIRGTLSRGEPGVRVQILKRGCAAPGDRTAARTTTGIRGQWSTYVRPGSTTLFYAKVDRETSVPLRVRVRPRITLSKVGRGLLRARVLADRSLGGETVVVQELSRRRWVDRRRVVLRRIAKRGKDVVSGRTFSAANTARRRLRLLFPQRSDFDCYAAAASRPITG